MKKMMVLSFVLGSLVQGEAWGMEATTGNNSERSTNTPNEAQGDSPTSDLELKNFYEKVTPLHFDQNLALNEKGMIAELKKAGQKFSCAFTLRDKKEAKTWENLLARPYNKVKGTYNAVVRGTKTRRGDFNFGGEGDKSCLGTQSYFPVDWSPFSDNKDVDLENFVRNLKFDVDTNKNGEALAGQNIKNGWIGKKKVDLGWFGMSPLQTGKGNLNLMRNRKNADVKNDLSSRSHWQNFTDGSGLLDCNASGMMCSNSEDFFRRLKGCSMRSIYQSGMPLGCLKSAINSRWVHAIALGGDSNKKDETSDGNPKEKTAKERRNAFNSHDEKLLKIQADIVWTFVMAELLERHDARRIRNNVVRALVDELGGMKEKKLSEVMGFVNKIKEGKVSASKEKLKQEITKALSDVVYPGTIETEAVAEAAVPTTELQTTVTEDK